MLTHEEAQELQAQVATFRFVLEWMRREACPDTATRDWPTADEQLQAFVDTAEIVLSDDTARDRLALERATVQALRERVRTSPTWCECPQCKRDRPLLAQWAALELEA